MMNRFDLRARSPTPLTVWIRLVENGSSTFFLSLRIATSTTLASLSKLMSQTCSEMRVRLKTSPWWEARSQRIANSLGDSSILFPCPARPAFEEIDLEVGYSHGLRPAVGTSAEYGADAGKKLGEGKGLHHVVIGAQLQALHLVVKRIPRREKEDRGLFARFSEVLDDRPAVFVRHHDIEDNERVVSRGRKMEAILAVLRDVHDKSVLRKPFPEVLGGLLLILYDKNPHYHLFRSPDEHVVTRTIRYVTALSCGQSGYPVRNVAGRIPPLVQDP